ncbi:MAG: ABC transporter ATP-binding protein [Ruminococcaceae bacterium]|nr:ABC transporter ATP-binding protein [Oscillospiraceae bacterium]
MIKKLAGSIREYKKHSLLAPLFVSLEVLMEVLIPLVMAKLIDQGIERINPDGTQGDIGALLRYGGLLCLLAVISLAMGALSGRSAAIASAGFARNLRHDLYYKVQDYSFSNIDKFSTSSLVTRLTTDVSHVQNAYQMIIRVAVRSPIMLISAMVAAFGLNRRLSLIFLAVIPVLGVGLYLITTNAHPIFVRAFKTYDKLNRVVQENLRGIRVVKSFVREEHEKDKFTDVSTQIFDNFSLAQKIVALNGPLMQSCIYICMLLIAWFGSHMIVSGTMSTGELNSLITYTMQILMSLMMLSMIFVMITISRASAERIVEVLDEEIDITDGEHAITEVPDGSISFRDVGFSYAKNSDRLCLSDIDLEIRSGETIGIIGSTGSSKSTLVQLIPRLYDVTEGELRVGGIDVRDYDIQALRDAVSMVLQKNVLFSGTIKENLRWGNADATDEEMQHACEVAQADGFIRTFSEGYDTYIEQGGSNVSGGQKQRLCIARALLKKPKILILDDSTSAVDTATDALIRKAMSEQFPETTKLIIAQRIASVQDSDRIIVMDNGKVAAFGTHEELLKDSDIYREAYYSQKKGGSDDE